ncbi:Lrp/AsnC family transcriptional regulator [Thalassobaculum sp.]|uniref:Lrp/AsnC family transcriptional regulator n=1 Tax=Thalassobaculum sp. TaxID=2022740 RepID=UPI0032EE4C2D
MDDLDRKILTLLQVDADLALADIAERVGLSTTPCWRRIQNLEKAGVIRARVALLDAAKINLGVTVFVRIRTNRHDLEWLELFARAIADIPEIVEVYRMSGDIDYVLKVVVPDITSYDAIYKQLIGSVPMMDVSSNFAMEEIKLTTALPLTYV